MLSLPIFRLARPRSLSLGAGWQPRKVARFLFGRSVWRSGGAGGELPGRSRTRADRSCAGGLSGVCSLSISGWRDRVFIPWRGWQPRNLARRFLFGYSVWRSRGGAGGELPGRSRTERDRSCAGGLSGVCSLSISGWRDPRLYPLARVAAEESGAGLAMSVGYRCGDRRGRRRR